ncbi:MAG: hypothetical protein ABEJ65_12025 [bacterium]
MGKFEEWIERWEDTKHRPGLEDVKKIRRECAVAGQDDRAQILAELEQQMKNSNVDVLDFLGERLEQVDQSGDNQEFALELEERGKFNDCRRRLMERHVSQAGGTILKKNDRSVKGHVFSSDALLKIQSLYGWVNRGNSG